MVGLVESEGAWEIRRVKCGLQWASNSLRSHYAVHETSLGHSQRYSYSYNHNKILTCIIDSAGKDDSKRQSIFSVHVHPDGSRIATGGLDAKIRIWSTKPILNPASELSNRPPKSLCTLTMHTGPVLAVRWAHSGRWLASGSDDQIVMIWDLDPYVPFILRSERGF